MSEHEPPDNETPATPAETSAGNPLSPEREALFRALIGPHKQAYYLSYIKRAEARGYAPLAWHWPAFFLGTFWCLWRRQYLLAAICVAFSIVVSLAASLLGGAGQALAQLAIVGFLGAYVPLKANAYYYAWARQSVASAVDQYPGQTASQLEYLADRGGVNQNLPLILGLFALLLIMLSPGPPPPGG